MSNDFDFPTVPDSGDLQPYSPQTPLAPSAPAGMPDWYIADAGEQHQSPGQQAMLFGQAVPDATPAQIDQFIDHTANVFESNMAQLKVNPDHVRLAANWLRTRATNIEHEFSEHSYSFHGFDYINSDYARDRDALTSFANEMSRHFVPAKTFRLFLSWWVEYSRRLEAQVQNQQPSGASIDSLSDAEYKQVLKLQPKHQAATKDYLRSLWGDHYTHRMQVAIRYFNNLPESHRDHFDSTVCKGGIILGDSAEAIEWMFQQAVAQAKPDIKTDNLQGEIAAIENIMKTDRSRYNKDEAMQERLRLLYELRGN